MTTPTRRAPSPGRGGHPPVERVLPGKNRATIIAIQLLIQSEEHAADLAETLLCAERDDPPYRDLHAQTHARILRLQQYIEHADMAAGVRHRLRQESIQTQDLIYPTLLHELETSRIWQAWVSKLSLRGGCN